MVQAEGKKTYPWISSKAWWDLRRRFIQAPPAKVDASYIQTVLNTDTPDAARSTLRGLKAVGLVDDANNRTPRAGEWRDDDRYADMCREMREAVYPQSLLEALPPPNPDREAAERWFSRDTGVGKSAVQKMAAFYLLLCEADVSDAGKTAERSQRAATSERKRQRGNGRAPNPPQTIPAVNGQTEVVPPATPTVHAQVNGPALHMDIHIHIEPGLSPEQIDQVFASMSKHLYGGQVVK